MLFWFSFFFWFRIWYTKITGCTSTVFMTEKWSRSTIQSSANLKLASRQLKNEFKFSSRQYFWCLYMHKWWNYELDTISRWTNDRKFRFEVYLELIDFNALPAYITEKMPQDDKNRWKSLLRFLWYIHWSLLEPNLGTESQKFILYFFVGVWVDWGKFLGTNIFID